MRVKQKHKCRVIIKAGEPSTSEILEAHCSWGYWTECPFPSICATGVVVMQDPRERVPCLFRGGWVLDANGAQPALPVSEIPYGHRLMFPYFEPVPTEENLPQAQNELMGIRPSGQEHPDIFNETFQQYHDRIR